MKHERTTLCKFHIGFSRALHKDNELLRRQIADANYDYLKKTITNAKPAPSSAPALIGRQVVICSFDRDKGQQDGAEKRRLR